MNQLKIWDLHFTGRHKLWGKVCNYLYLSFSLHLFHVKIIHTYHKCCDNFPLQFNLVENDYSLATPSEEAKVRASKEVKNKVIFSIMNALFTIGAGACQGIVWYQCDDVVVANAMVLLSIKIVSGMWTRASVKEHVCSVTQFHLHKLPGGDIDNTALCPMPW